MPRSTMSVEARARELLSLPKRSALSRRFFGFQNLPLR
jgi:hypothetical protein